MSNNLTNPGHSIIRAAEEDSGGGGAAVADPDRDMGLIAGLDKFLEENPDATGKEGSTETVEPISPSEEIVPSDDSPPEKSGGVLTEQEEDFGLPTLGKEGGEKLEEVSEEVSQFNEEAFDDETTNEVKGLDPAKGEAWKKLKEELKGYKKGEIQLPEVQGKLEALEKENVTLRETADEVEAIKTRMRSVTSRNAELLLEESDDYYNGVVAPHKEISSTIEALSEAKGISEAEIWDVIKENDAAKRITKLDELERHIGGRNSLLVQNMANDMRSIAYKDKEMRDNAETIVGQSRNADARVQEERTATQVADFKTSAKQAFGLHASKIPGFADDSGILTDAGRAAQANTTTVDVSALSSGDLAYMAFTTEALPQSLRTIKSLEKENRDLRVAAGGRASDILPGGSNKKAVEDDIDPKTGTPLGLLDLMATQKFDSAI